ncbi:UDP-N-acetylglucosamine--N-acetylmuramyl-(pentapeptide) pyrophosphoryl-undecaprenol N-acetylglucosamine transferase [Candidatus Cyrtobacter comes]|uniref:UDP-N-acetylglucosamine--N-acetylmuramyl-(pentapeptide) pyrophosphoryl-undecaprenol N-acetylglucosamine transferase n=1 Tax=Candidatus Cyrtobacter comes TaxID=675776 RepID=A0ABU5L8W5_9RICK|nr:glycosyltransferase [Candidatus Cyrtobacter comes]MDZ5762561.1 UDP-N-acetylglucosamine--N-acetylmuramyl-(pentapeptide) pyrophosphoryl-undecaprenol N-acetylglucosamine transferase [Candidatus Cyrtobacter comes]
MNRGYLVIAAGGTGGHVIPAQVLGEELKQRIDIEYITDSRGLRYFKNIGDNKIKVLGLKRMGYALWCKLIIIFQIMFYALKLAIVFIIKRPRLVISFGGYPCAAAGVAAFLARVPIIIYEQNSVVGKTNSLMMVAAQYIITSFPNVSVKPRYQKKVHVLRPPNRVAFENMQKTTTDTIITIIGGSQGSSLFSKVIPDSINMLKNKHNVKVFHQVRREDIKKVTEFYIASGINAEVKEFCENILELFSQSSILIARAGASSIFEILYLRKPSILIPLANSANNHQLFNAKYLADNQAAILIEEKVLNAELLSNTISNLMSDKRLYEKIENNLAYIEGMQQKKTIRDFIEEVISGA